MNARNFKPVAAAVIVLGCLGALSAQAEGFYAGASVGAPNYLSSVNGNSGNGSGISGKVFGGYQFSPNFALEAGVADLGHNDNGNGSVYSSGQFVDAVGIAPISDKWSLLGRVGIANVNMTTSGGNDSGTGLKVGLGAQYSLTKTVALRAEWERYQPQVFGSTENIDQYNMGVRVAF